MAFVNIVMKFLALYNVAKLRVIKDTKFTLYVSQ